MRLLVPASEARLAVLGQVNLQVVRDRRDDLAVKAGHLLLSQRFGVLLDLVNRALPNEMLQCFEQALPAQCKEIKKVIEPEFVSGYEIAIEIVGQPIRVLRVRVLEPLGKWRGRFLDIRLSLQELEVGYQVHAVQVL